MKPIKNILPTIDKKLNSKHILLLAMTTINDKK
jgi:hypothetical protein